MKREIFIPVAIVLLVFVVFLAYRVLSKRSAWIVEKAGLKKVELKQEFEISSDEFGYIADIQVDSRGRIYICDGMNNTIHLYSGDGKFLRKIGKAGEGPGEFKMLTGIIIGENDTVYAIDDMLRRITIFAPDKFDKPVAVIKVQRPSNLSVYPTTPIFLQKNGDFLLTYREYYTTVDYMKPKYMYLFQVDRNGQTGQNPLLKVPAPQILVFGEGGSFSLIGIHFGEKTILRSDSKGNIYFANSSVLGINSLGFDGEQKNLFSYEVDKIKITKKKWLKLFRGDENKYLRLNKSLTPVPKFLPVIGDFIVDSKGRFWIVRDIGKDDYDYICMVFDDKGNKISQFDIPDNVSFKLCSGYYVYAVKKNELDVQSVVKYRVIEK
jgi:sugar lactone lactonase YvrE